MIAKSLRANIKKPRLRISKSGIAATLLKCVKREVRSGVSVNHLAMIAGVSQPSIARWLSADTKTARDGISLDTAEKLAKFFGLSLS